jgi:hypothetical protein
MNHALANKKTSTGAENGEQKPAPLDFCRTERGPRLGVEPEGLSAVKNEIRTASGSDRPKESMRQDRADADYVIDAVAKALKVFEALEGRSFEPVSVARVVQRTGFNRDTVFRSLKTLKVCGYAKETLDGWILGPKAEALAKKLSASLFSKSAE